MAQTQVVFYWHKWFSIAKKADMFLCNGGITILSNSDSLVWATY